MGKSEPEEGRQDFVFNQDAMDFPASAIHPADVGMIFVENPFLDPVYGHIVGIEDEGMPPPALCRDGIDGMGQKDLHSESLMVTRSTRKAFSSV